MKKKSKRQLKREGSRVKNLQAVEPTFEQIARSYSGFAVILLEYNFRWYREIIFALFRAKFFYLKTM